jgi:hypothetical protein
MHLPIDKGKPRHDKARLDKTTSRQDKGRQDNTNVKQEKTRGNLTHTPFLDTGKAILSTQTSSITAQSFASDTQKPVLLAHMTAKKHERQSEKRTKTMRCKAESCDLQTTAFGLTRLGMKKDGCVFFILQFDLKNNAMRKFVSVYVSIAMHQHTKKKKGVEMRTNVVWMTHSGLKKKRMRPKKEKQFNILKRCSLKKNVFVVKNRFKLIICDGRVGIVTGASEKNCLHRKKRESMIIGRDDRTFFSS